MTRPLADSRPPAAAWFNHALRAARTVRAWRGRGAALLLAGLVLLVAASPAVAQRVDSEKIAKVKAAYVYNFIKFTTWPAKAFRSEDAPIEIGVVGNTPVLGHLRTLAGDTRVQRRELVVRSIPLPRTDRDGSVDRESLAEFGRQVRNVHVLFLADDAAGYKTLVIAQLRRADVLSVSDVPGFATSGGMLELVLRENRILFDANTGAIGETKVEVSSKVLRLARVVKTES